MGISLCQLEENVVLSDVNKPSGNIGEISFCGRAATGRFTTENLCRSIQRFLAYKYDMYSVCGRSRIVSISGEISAVSKTTVQVSLSDLAELGAMS